MPSRSCIRLVAGERKIYLGWPFDWDLDDPDTFRSQEDFRLFRAVDVLWADAYLDAEGRLAIAQHVRIRDAGRIVARLNELAREAMLEDEPSAEEVDADPESAAQRAFALAGRDVFEFEGPMLWVSFPTSDSEAWHIEQLVKHGSGVQGVAAWRQVPGAIMLRFGDSDRPEWSLSYTHEEMTYDPALCRTLEQEGLPRAESTKDALLERFRARASEPVDEASLQGRRAIDKD
jgi:hypothetical protein